MEDREPKAPSDLEMFEAVSQLERLSEQAEHDPTHFFARMTPEQRQAYVYDRWPALQQLRTWRAWYAARPARRGWKYQARFGRSLAATAAAAVLSTAVALCFVVLAVIGDQDRAIALVAALAWASGTLVYGTGAWGMIQERRPDALTTAEKEHIAVIRHNARHHP